SRPENSGRGPCAAASCRATSWADIPPRVPRHVPGSPPGSAAAEVGHDQRPVLGEGDARVVRDLPGVAARFGEAAGVPAVEGLRRRPRHRRAGLRGGRHDLVDLLAGAHVVGRGDPAEAAGVVVADPGVLRELVPAPQHQRHAPGLEEDRVLDLLATPPQRLVEREGPLEVRDAQGDEAHPLLHDANATPAAGRLTARSSTSVTSAAMSTTSPSDAPPVAEPRFESIPALRESLRQVDYLADEGIAGIVYLADRLGKPILVEGPAGTGKTQLAKSVAEVLGARLIRLQCYEGLDEAKA